MPNHIAPPVVSRHTARWHWVGAWLLLTWGAIPAQAQSPTGEPAADTLRVEPVIEDEALLTSQEADPPARVARLGYLSGEADIAPAGSDEWAEAVLNRPLTSGDRLWVQPGARTELQAAGTVIYLDESTRFGFITLDDEVLQASLTQGAATIRVRRLAAGETLQLETPQATIVLREVGEYHLNVAADGSQTTVKTRSGLAEVRDEQTLHRVAAGHAVQFTGFEPLQASTGLISDRTAFEDWANQRDARTTRSQSAQYVAEDVIGYEDLDEHGQWQYEPEYGNVWQPRQVAVDWAPYRDGRWGWVAPWGWTWIDASRWGFAPFHYGRWVQVRQRWCWVPGPRHHRAVYSPALVGWVGSAPLTVSVSIGNIGWYPLGPRDLYRPGYRHSRHYVQRINISNTIFITQRDFHRGLPAIPRFDARRHHHGLTAVRYDLFVGARPLRGNYLRLDQRGLRQWHAHSYAPAIAPYRESVLIGRLRHGPTVSPHHRDFMPGRISFHHERRAIETNGGRPLDRLQLRAGTSRNNADLQAQRRQWQRELGQRNASLTRDSGTGGNRIVRDQRQGFQPGFTPSPHSGVPQRLDERARNRTLRDGNDGRSPRMQGDARQRNFQQNERWQRPPAGNTDTPEVARWRAPSQEGRTPENGQRWRNPPARTQAPDTNSRFRNPSGGTQAPVDNQRFRAPPPRENRGNQQRNSPAGQREQGSSSFVTQPQPQRSTQPNSPPRNEPTTRPRSPERAQSRDPAPQRADRGHRSSGNQRNLPQTP